MRQALVAGERHPRVYEFGPFRVDAAERVLLRAGRPVPLTPKLFDTLLALVERSGHVVEKSELMETVWPETFVEESNLSSNVSLLRKTLGEGGCGPYIETVPRRGYRFSADVRVSGGGPAEEELVVRRVTRARVVTTEEQDEGPALAPAPGRGELAATSSTLKTLAVLPFTLLGGARDEDEYLGLGLADALITQFGNTGRIVVRPTSAVLKYAGGGPDSVTAGRELGVDAVVEGSVQRAGDRLRVTVRMLGVAGGVPLWADKFDARFTDLFEVQDSISEQVARALATQLSGERRERLHKRYTADVEAYQAYLRGRYFLNKRNVEGFRKAVAHFKAAIELDPAYALAYSGLSDTYSLLASWGEQPAREALPRALAAAERALEIDPELSEAHASRGNVLYYMWDPDAGEISLRRAIELNPNYATAHNRYAQLLVSQERFAEAEAHIRRAQELDPLSPMVNTAVGGPYFYSRQYDRALEQYRKVLELEPEFIPALFCLGIALSQKGEHDEAVAAFRKGAEVSGQHPIIVAGLAAVLAAAGRREEALSLVDALKSGSTTPLPYSLATVYARLGDADRALEYLEQAYEERNTHLHDLNIDPEFDLLRSDPRFLDLKRRVGLKR